MLCKNKKLIYDEACLDILNQLNDTISIFGQYSVCHNCNFKHLTTLPPQQNTSLLVNARYPLQLYYENGNTTHCNFENLFHEHYRYGWIITDNCARLYVKEPADNAYLPILMAFVIIFCLGILWYMVKCIYKNSGKVRHLLSWSSQLKEHRGSSAGQPLDIERTPSLQKHPHRIKSVDVFRGLCIILMIFVNSGGGKYWFFAHSVWNGITIADLVFPWFLWIMGLSSTIALQKRLRGAVPRSTIFFQILRRTLILIFLGLIIDLRINTIAQLRFPGVLQKIGITYFLVAVLELIFTKWTEIEQSNLFISDIIQAWPQWLFVIMLIVIHTCVTFLVDIPGCGRGYIGPGGIDDYGKFYDCAGGASGYIDRKVFGKHMAKYRPFQAVYETTVRLDPEGILSTLTSILIVYLGVQAGRILQTYKDVKGKVLRWIIWGVVTGLTGGGLCSFSRDGGPIPLNRSLWSLSLALVTAGLAFWIQAFLFVIVDTLHKWGGRPFFYPGMNAIVLYLGHSLLIDTFPFGWTPTVETHAAYLFINIWGTALWVSIANYLYKHDSFFTI